MTFKVLLKDTAPVIAACKEATVVFVAPFPRYVTAGCCDDPEHLTNRNSEDLKVELYKAIDLATLVVESDESLSDAYILKISDVFNTEKGLSLMETTDGSSAWAPFDPVHLSESAYTDFARAIMTLGCDAAAGSGKRERLASIVPGSVAWNDINLLKHGILPTIK